MGRTHSSHCLIVFGYLFSFWPQILSSWEGVVKLRAGLWIPANGFGPSIHYQWCLLLVYTASCLDSSSISLCFLSTLEFFWIPCILVISSLLWPQCLLEMPQGRRDLFWLSLSEVQPSVVGKWSSVHGSGVCSGGCSHHGRPGKQEPRVPTIYEGPCPMTYRLDLRKYHVLPKVHHQLGNKDSHCAGIGDKSDSEHSNVIFSPLHSFSLRRPGTSYHDFLRQGVQQAVFLIS